MKLSHFTSVLILAVFPFLIGCGSGSYNIEKGDYKDTTKYKSTGAKLKNFYRIQSPPRFTLQFSGNFNLGMAELSSNFQNVFDANQFSEGLNFGVKNGYGLMLIGKIPLHREGNIRLNISGNYNSFKSDFLADSSPFGDVKYNVFSFGAGIENSFNPSFRLKPFIAAEIQANIISGEANIIDQSTGSTRHVRFKPTFRMGYMIYSGLEYMINKQFGINGGLKLTNSNQVPKQNKGSDNPDEVPIRDKKNDYDIHEFGGFKNFIFTSLFLGVSYYFGVKDIIYQFNK
jgi:hypothetical protein